MGATSGGGLHQRPVLGERFCVPNSGRSLSVEGVGDDGCEYIDRRPGCRLRQYRPELRRRDEWRCRLRMEQEW